MPPPFAVQDADAPEVTIFSIDRKGNVVIVGSLTVQGKTILAGGGTAPALFTTANLTDAAISVRNTGDTGDRWDVLGNGSLHWGSGTGAVDTDLSRAGAGALQTSGNFTALGNVGAGVLLLIGADGQISRTALNTLTVANNLIVSGTLTSTGAFAASGAATVATTLGVTGAATLSSTVTAGGHVLSTGAAPTAVAGANAGTSPPAPVVAASSTDVRGSVTFGTGTTPAAGAECVVTFATAYSSPPVVMLTETTSLTTAINPYVTTTVNGFTINANAAPAASQSNTTYGVMWMVIG